LRARIDLAYDGTDFAGWARQPGLRTVQGTLEDALQTILRLPQPPALTVAGRTDAGVHASGQVAHGEFAVLPSTRQLNSLLPVDVRVLALASAADGFDARFSALSRRYRYRVADNGGGAFDPLRRHDTLAWPRALDLTAMNTASNPLLGEHDFAAYCKRREGATTIRRLIQLRWRRSPDGTLEATVEADAFCHSMVRALVGALLAVGEGRRPVQWPAEVLAAGLRDSGVFVAPAHGLCLEQVRYPPDSEQADRAAVTRRLRTREPQPGGQNDPIR
jgi:tRNA pseudouridine38-40 synthase